MMILIAAAAVAAAQPVSPAPAGPMTQHDTHKQSGHAAEHKDMDCCKECCKDMATKHEGHSAEDEGHSGQ